MKKKINEKDADNKILATTVIVVGKSVRPKTIKNNLRTTL